MKLEPFPFCSVSVVDQRKVPSLTKLVPTKRLVAPLLALKAVPAPSVHVPVKSPPLQAIRPADNPAPPDSTAALPCTLPPLWLRLSDWKAPLKVDAPAITTAPAPLKREPALKMLLPPLNLMVPTWASMRPPSLRNSQPPTLVMAPAVLEKLPVLTNSGGPPKLWVSELASDCERHSPALFTTAPLPPCSGSANQRTRL